jgi:hypothetical protein
MLNLNNAILPYCENAGFGQPGEKAPCVVTEGFLAQYEMATINAQNASIVTIYHGRKKGPRLVPVFVVRLIHHRPGRCRHVCTTVNWA